MSSHQILVNHAGVQGLADRVRGTATDIQARLDALAARLQPLAAEWEGAQQVAYHDAKHRWDTAIREMIVLLEHAGAAVRAADEEYRAADRRGSARFGG